MSVASVDWNAIPRKNAALCAPARLVVLRVGCGRVELEVALDDPNEILVQVTFGLVTKTYFSTDCKKSFSVATFLLARIANMPASVATLLSSAPVALGHNLEMSSHLMSRSTDMLFA